MTARNLRLPGEALSVSRRALPAVESQPQRPRGPRDAAARLGAGATRASRVGRLSRRWAISAAVLAGLLLTAAPRASAQADPQMDQGLVPYKAYQGGAIDDISLSTGDVYIHIPLVSFPQRGGKLTLQFKLVANSPVFAAEGGCNPYTGVCTYTWAPTGNFGAALVDA